MARRQTEPVKHTCPDINRLVSTITRITIEMKSCNEGDDKSLLLDQISDWKSDLEIIGVGNRCELEDLRSSNSALRDWGQNMYEEAESLENERDYLQSKYETALEDIKYLERQLQQIV